MQEPHIVVMIVRTIIGSLCRQGHPRDLAPCLPPRVPMGVVGLPWPMCLLSLALLLLEDWMDNCGVLLAYE